MLALLKPFGVEATLRTATLGPLGLRYEVALGDEDRDLQLLNEAPRSSSSDGLQLQMRVPVASGPPPLLPPAFLRGLFLGCGSVSAPVAFVDMESPMTRTWTWAAQVQGMLARLDLPFKLAERDRNVACYTERSQTAADLFAVLGADQACLRWEEHAVLGTVRENANRLANCDEANARRAAAAAARQAAAARALMASSEWGAAPRLLRDAAELRLRYPYLSLRRSPAGPTRRSPSRR